MKRHIIAAASCLLIAGCASPEPRIITKEVRVEVPVSCNPKVPPSPQYDDSPAAIQAAQDIYDAVKLLLAGREQRIAREQVLSAAVGCPINNSATGGNNAAP